jgi:hypothetical protein
MYATNQMYVYTVIENGEAYPFAYPSYELAVQAVKRAHQEELATEELAVDEFEDFGSVTMVNVPEDVETGRTELYIEKEIYIAICRLTVLY